jgi:hypothetical protein
MPVRLKPLLAISALALALAAAAPAAAQQAPTLGAPETTQSTAAPPPESETSEGNGGLETWQEILIFCAGLALLLGIGFAIVGDARERAGRLARRGRGEPETAGAGVPHKHRQQAKQRARAKARAARAQRRKNR